MNLEEAKLEIKEMRPIFWDDDYLKALALLKGIRSAKDKDKAATLFIYAVDKLKKKYAKWILN